MKFSLPRRWRPWTWSFALLTALGLGWLGVDLLLSFFVPSWNPSLRGVLALWATLVAFGFTARTIGLRVRRPSPFSPLNEALGRIARGDYSVQVPEGLGIEGDRGAAFRDLAQNFNTMAGALARVEDLRRQFVADVSHEFQSPLTSILGFAQALRDPRLPEVQRQRYLAIVESEARRLSRLADNLLKLNALEEREGPPDPQTFRLDVQLRRVLVALEPQWSPRDLEIQAALDVVEAWGNEELWTQVWTNIVHNAIKFTPAGGHIAVRLRGSGAGWVVEVEDSGVGLAPEELERVFERFYKAEASRTPTEGGGSGLGLALVHRIVTLHGARVEALSPGWGQGTTLRVSYRG